MFYVLLLPQNNMNMTSCGGEYEDGGKESEELKDLFCEIWERESQPELTFAITGVGSVVQTQDLQGHRWEVNNFSNTVWEAAIWMHHFFQDKRCFSPGWLRDRHVLEVGAGTGLVGLSLALLGSKVTMTDLPEALPILRHNTEATFGTLRDNDGSLSQDRHKADGAAVGKCEACRRPTIRQLSWGDEVEAEEVAAAAAAKCAEEGETEWQGFDLIVGADVIYNEPTFPALVSTLSDRRLCSDKTLVYLATMLRGGRHEGLLEMLNENGFHVRALDPACADDLRARVAGDNCGGGGGTCSKRRAWTGPEWRRGNPEDTNKRKIEIVPVRSADEGENDSRGQGGVTRDDGVTSEARKYCRGSLADHGEAGGGGGHDSTGTALAREAPLGGAIRRFGRGPIPADVKGGGWGYKEHGLGKILAFVARRRCDGGGEGGFDGVEADV